MSRINYVYALRDPDTYRCHYVGVTFNLRSRLTTHLLSCYSWIPPSCKDIWLKNLSKPPILEILEYFTIKDRDRHTSENYWIREMLRRGEPLTNTPERIRRAYLKTVT